MADKKKFPFKLIQVSAYKIDAKTKAAKFVEGIDLETGKTITFSQEGFSKKSFVQSMADEKDMVHAKIGSTITISDVTQQKNDFYTAKNFRIISQDVEAENAIVSPTKLYVNGVNNSFAVVMDDIDLNTQLVTNTAELPSKTFEKLNSQSMVGGPNAMRGVFVRLVGHDTSGADIKDVILPLEINSQGLSSQEFTAKYADKFRTMVDTYNYLVANSDTPPVIEVIGTNILPIHQHPGTIKNVSQIKNRSFTTQGENQLSQWGLAALRLKRHPDSGAFTVSKVTPLSVNKLDIDPAGLLGNHLTGEKTIPVKLTEKSIPAIKKPKTNNEPVKQSVGDSTIKTSTGYPVKISDISTSNGSLSQCLVKTNLSFYSQNRDRFDALIELEGGFKLVKDNQVSITFDSKSKPSVNSELSDLAGTPAIYSHTGVHQQQPALFIYGRVNEQPFKEALDAAATKYSATAKTGYYTFQQSDAAAVLSELAPILNKASISDFVEQQVTMQPVKAAATKPNKPQIARKKYDKDDYSEYYKWIDDEFRNDPNLVLQATTDAGYLSSAASDIGVDWDATFENVSLMSDKDSMKLTGKDVKLLSGKRNTNIMVSVVSNPASRQNVKANALNLNSTTPNVFVSFTSRSTSLQPVSYGCLSSKQYGTLFDIYLRSKTKGTLAVPTDAALELQRKEKAERIANDRAIRIDEQNNALKNTINEFERLADGFSPEGYAVNKGINEIAHLIQIKHGQWAADQQFDCYPLFDIQGNFISTQKLFKDKLKDNLTGEETVNKIIATDTVYTNPETGEKTGVHAVVGFSELIDETKPIMFMEGLADASSGHKATGNPCVVCVDIHNMQVLVEMFRERYPERELIVIADNDVLRNRKYDNGNVGVQAAIDAAFNNNAKYVIPDFTGIDLAQGPSDINDIEIMAGLDVLSAQLENPNNILPAPKNIAEYHITRLKYEGFDSFDKAKEEAVDALKKALPTRNEVQIREFINSNVAKPLPVEERIATMLSQSKYSQSPVVDNTIAPVAEAVQEQAIEPSQPANEIQDSPQNTMTSDFDIEYKLVAMSTNPSKKHFVFLDNGNNAERIMYEIEKMDGVCRKHKQHDNVYYVPAKYGYLLASRMSELTGAPQVYLSVVQSGEDKGNVIIKGRVVALEHIQKNLNEIPTHYNVEQDGVVIPDPLIAKMTTAEKTLLVDGESTTQVTPFVSILEFKFKELFKPLNENTQQIEKLLSKKPLVGDDIQDQLNNVKEIFDLSEAQIQYGYFGLVKNGLITPKTEYISGAIFIKAFTELKQDYPAMKAYELALQRVVDDSSVWLDFLDIGLTTPNAEETIESFKQSVGEMKSKLQAISETNEANYELTDKEIESKPEEINETLVEAKQESVTKEDIADEQATADQFDKDIAFSRQSELVNLMSVSIGNGVFEAEEFEDDYLKAKGSDYIDAQGAFNRDLLNYDIRNLNSEAHDGLPDGFKATNIATAFNALYTPVAQERFNVFKSWVDVYINEVSSVEKKTFRRYLNNESNKDLGIQNPYIANEELNNELMTEEIQMFSNSTTARGFLISKIEELKEQGIDLAPQGAKDYLHSDDGYTITHEIIKSEQDTPLNSFIIKNDNNETQFYIAHTKDSADISGIDQALHADIVVSNQGLANKLSNTGALTKVVSDDRIIMAEVDKSEQIGQNKVALYKAQLENLLVGVLIDGESVKYIVGADNIEASYDSAIEESKSNQLQDGNYLSSSIQTIGNNEINEVVIHTLDQQILRSGFALTSEGIEAIRVSATPLETFDNAISILKPQIINELETGEQLQKFTVPSANIYKVLDVDGTTKTTTDYTRAKLLFGHLEDKYTPNEPVEKESVAFTAQALDSAISRASEDASTNANDIAEQLKVSKDTLPLEAIDKAISQKKIENVIEKSLSPTEKWESFIGFMSDNITSGVEYTDFFQESFNPSGELLQTNPYFDANTNKIDNAALRNQLKSKGYKSLHAMFDNYQKILVSVSADKEFRPFIPETYDSSSLATSTELGALKNLLKEYNPVETKSLIPFKNFVSTAAALMPIHPIFMEDIQSLSSTEMKEKYPLEAYLLVAEIHGIKDVIETTSKNDIAELIVYQWSIRKDLAGMSTSDIQELDEGSLQEYSRQLDLGTSTNARANAKAISKHLESLKEQSVFKFAQYNFLKQVFANADAQMRIPAYTHTDINRLVTADFNVVDDNIKHNVNRIAAMDLRNNRLTPLLKSINIPSSLARATSLSLERGAPVSFGLKKSDHIKPGPFIYQVNDGKVDSKTLMPAGVGYFHKLDENTFSTPVEIENDHMIKHGYSPISDKAVLETSLPMIEFAHRFGYIAFSASSLDKDNNVIQKLVVASSNSGKDISVTEITTSPEYSVNVSSRKTFEDVALTYAGELKDFADIDLIYEQFQNYMPEALVEQTNDLRNLAYNISQVESVSDLDIAVKANENLLATLETNFKNTPQEDIREALQGQVELWINESLTSYIKALEAGQLEENNYLIDDVAVTELTQALTSIYSEPETDEVDVEQVAKYMELGTGISPEVVKDAEVVALANIDEKELELVGGATSEVVNSIISKNIGSTNKGEAPNNTVRGYIDGAFYDPLETNPVDIFAKDGPTEEPENIESALEIKNELNVAVGSYAINTITNTTVVIKALKDDNKVETKLSWVDKLESAQNRINQQDDEKVELVDPRTNKLYVAMGLTEFMKTDESKKQVVAQRFDLLDENTKYTLRLLPINDLREVASFHGQLSALLENDKDKLVDDLLNRVKSMYILMDYKVNEGSETPSQISLDDAELIKSVTGESDLKANLEWMEDARKDLVTNIAMSNYSAQDTIAEQFGFIPDTHIGSAETSTASIEDLTIITQHQFAQNIDGKNLIELIDTLDELNKQEDLVKPMPFEEPIEGQMAAISYVLYDQFGTLYLHDETIEQLQNIDASIRLEGGVPTFVVNDTSYASIPAAIQANKNVVYPKFGLEVGQMFAFKTNTGFEYGPIETLTVERKVLDVTLEGNNKVITVMSENDFTLVSTEEIQNARKSLTNGYDETIKTAIERFNISIKQTEKASEFIALTELITELTELDENLEIPNNYEISLNSGEFQLKENDNDTSKLITTVQSTADVIDAYSIHAKAKLIQLTKGNDDDPEPDPNNDPTTRTGSAESLSDVSAPVSRRVNTRRQSSSNSPSFSAENTGQTGRGIGESESTGNEQLPSESERDTGQQRGNVVTSPEGASTGSKITKQAEYLLPEGYEADSLGSPAVRIDNNIAAIEIMNLCHHEERGATDIEKDTLKKYVGWGGLSSLFEERNFSTASKRLQLKDLLSPDEYVLAKNSTTTAFYTPEAVSRGVYDVLSDIDIKNNTFCDPCTGSGNFIGTMPQEMSEQLNVSAFDIDKTSANITGLIYGQDLVNHKPFEEVAFPNGYFDLFVSNIPFGDTRPHDRKHNKDKKLIHDYFISKSLDLTREGGYATLITSTGTLDKNDTSARKKISEKAHLVGAIRLPNGTFGKIAGTNAAADILIFQKDSNAKNLPTPSWVNSNRVTLEYSGNDVGIDVVNLNQYFIDNPDNVIGDLRVQKNQFNKPVVAIIDDKTQLREKINKIGSTFDFDQVVDLADVEDIEEDIETEVLSNQNTIFNQIILDEKNELKKVVKVWDGESETYIKASAEYTPFSKTDKTVATEISILKQFVGLRDHVEIMLAHQNDPTSPKDVISGDIKTLNDLYDRFQKDHGLLNAQRNRKIITQDPTSPKVLALVLFNKEVKLETKLDIFNKRVINPTVNNDRIETIKDALISSISSRGTVDIGKAADLYGLSYESFLEESNGQVYLNPSNDTWEISELYLSGDVKTKLAEAKAINENTNSFNENVKALTAVIPKDIPSTDIYVQSNSGWVPEKYIKQFIQLVIKGEDTKTIAHWNDASRVGTLWGVDINQFQINQNKSRTENQFGTPRFHAGKVLDAVLNNKKVLITDEIDGKKINNKKQTAMAISKVNAVRDLFQKWVWADPERAADLQSIYNNKVNRYVMPEYDGSAMKYNGLSSSFKGKDFDPRIHQKNALLRYMLERNVLLAHGVGTGKTFTFASIALEGKAAGIHSKPLLAVPNNVLSQIDTAIAQHYPDANILVLDPKTFNAQGRKELTAQIAFGDWDLVVVPHSMTQKLAVSPDFQSDVIEQEKYELEIALDKMEDSNAFNGHHTKRQRNKIQKLEEKIKDLTDTGRKDDVLYIDELGLDALLVDEADNFLNLLNSTGMGHIKGVNNTSSQRAMDMLSWVRNFQDNEKGGVVFATGTDIRNTMGDIFTNAKFIAPDLLEAAGLSSHDEFMSVFGKVVSSIELNPEGTGFGVQERLAEFDNLPELLYLYRCFADVVSADMIDMERPDHNVIIEDTPTNDYHKSFMNDLSELAKDARNGGNSNILAVMGMGVKGAVDLRLVNPDAPDLENNKINTLVRNVLAEYERGHEQKTTQLAFLDTGVNTAPFNAYDEIIKKLVAGGMKPDEIIDSRRVKTDTQKKDFEEGMNSGRYRFAIGSTEKFGVGNNIQERLIALHDVDPTWRTREMVQRLGRGLRQGNTNEVLNHFRYTQQDSFDYFMWQTLNRKHLFTEQIKQDPSKAGRSLNEEVGAEYKELMAMTSNNPKIKQSIELRGEVDSLEIKIENAKFQIGTANRNISSYEDRLDKNTSRISEFTKFNNKLDHSKGIDLMGIGKMPNDPEEFAKYKKKLIKGVNAVIKNNKGKLPKIIELGEAYGQRLVLNRKSDDDKGYNLQITGDNNERFTISENSFKNSMFDSLTIIDNYFEARVEQLENGNVRLGELITADREVLLLPEYSIESLDKDNFNLSMKKADLIDLEYDIQQELNDALGKNVLPTLDELIMENMDIDQEQVIRKDTNPDQAPI